jgi:adenylate cyclase
MAGELLKTYLGRSTAGRVLAGEIRRGHMQRIQAAIFVCDLRGFTRFSNTHDEAAVIDRLNRYFDAVGAPVEAHGGEILKFQGDGLMAIFRDGAAAGDRCAQGGDGVGGACRRAIAAAVAAVAAVGASADDGEPPLDVGIALHYGSVAYGNIGTQDRLDFTVVGHDVNLAYRLERQCAALRQRIILTADVAGASGVVARSLGWFDLRGFDAPQELFTFNAVEATGA